MTADACTLGAGDFTDWALDQSWGPDARYLVGICDHDSDWGYSLMPLHSPGPWSITIIPLDVAVAVPEPAATWLLLAGVGMLGWWSERRVRRGG